MHYAALEGFAQPLERVRRYLPAGDQDADGDGQVEAAALFGNSAGDKLTVIPAYGKIESARHERRPDSHLAVAHHGFRQPDHRKFRHPGAQMEFDAHQRGRESQWRPAQNRAHVLVSSHPSGRLLSA